MPNLSVEGLQHVISTGDLQPLYGGGSNGLSAPGKAFADVLKSSLDQVNQDQIEANNAIKQLVAGRNKNIHETLLTVERADASLKLMMQVRNKVLDAYREVMRMQV